VKTLPLIFLLIALSTIILPSTMISIYSTRYEKEPHNFSIINDIVDTPAGKGTSYGFSVPSDATDVRLVGRYESHGGLIEQINVYVAAADSCPQDDLINCDTYYLQQKKAIANVNLSLPSGKEYYLIFYNDALFESKQTEVNFDLYYDLLVPIEDEPQKEPQGNNGCLIATATFGSELAPQVQLLREIRDKTLLQTNSGSLFMTSFNSLYYSFSPTIADWERQSPVFKEVVKTTIMPMLSTLSILNYVDINSEQEMLGYGIGIILLNLGMYFVAPAIVILKIKSRFS